MSEIQSTDSHGNEEVITTKNSRSNLKRKNNAAALPNTKRAKITTNDIGTSRVTRSKKNANINAVSSCECFK